MFKFVFYGQTYKYKWSMDSYCHSHIVQYTCKHFTPGALSIRPVVLHVMLPLLSLILVRENEAFLRSFFVLVHSTRI
jgi:hypothetical protein